MSRPRGRSVMPSEIPGPSVLRMLVPFGAPLGKTTQWSLIAACGLTGSLGSSSSLYPSLLIAEYLMDWGKSAQYVTGAASISLMYVCYVLC